MFIGYQPGGNADSVLIEQLKGWPAECEYALDRAELKIAGWSHARLAMNMQRIWGVATLKKCTGLNAIFFRAPNLREWRQVEKSLRAEIEEFSLSQVRCIIHTLKPKKLAIIGLSTFDWLTNGSRMSPILVRNGRVLVVCGKFLDVPAFGVIHLSGARIGEADVRAIRTYFAALNSN